jgi:hypothetical protein
MEKEGLRGKVRETWKVQVFEGPVLLASHENNDLVTVSVLNRLRKWSEKPQS